MRRRVIPALSRRTSYYVTRSVFQSYVNVLGFERISRPNFPFPGAWLRVSFNLLCRGTLLYVGLPAKLTQFSPFIRSSSEHS